MKDHQLDEQQQKMLDKAVNCLPEGIFMGGEISVGSYRPAFFLLLSVFESLGLSTSIIMDYSNKILEGEDLDAALTYVKGINNRGAVLEAETRYEEAKQFYEMSEQLLEAHVRHQAGEDAKAVSELHEFEKILQDNMRSVNVAIRDSAE